MTWICPPKLVRWGRRSVVYVCLLCRFETEKDDAIAPLSCGKCICLRCYARTTDTAVPMPDHLRRQLVAALAGVES